MKIDDLINQVSIKLGKKINIKKNEQRANKEKIVKQQRSNNGKNRKMTVGKQ